MTHRVLTGDCTAVLPTLEAGLVQCVVTSPPYFGLRDYGIPPTDWPEVRYAPMAGLPEVVVPAMTCCLGLEPDPAAFVGHLVAVFREVRRVLRDDGTAWLNLGDSFNGSGAGGGTGPSSPLHRSSDQQGKHTPITKVPGLQPKNLLGIPWRAAFALQADGWFLRSDIVWAKGVSCLPDYAGSCMPEPVRDRPVRGHEMVFLLAKRASYFYDVEAVREKFADARMGNPGAYTSKYASGVDKRTVTGLSSGWDGTEAGGRNLRSVWAISPEPSPVEHYAMMPSRLAALMIRAGTSERGACPACGSPWERLTEPGEIQSTGGGYVVHQGNTNKMTGGADKPAMVQRASRTVGWSPSCPCPVAEPVPCVVLDPFGGAGTTAKTAARLGRSSVLIELHPSHAAHATRSAGDVAPLFHDAA